MLLDVVHEHLEEAEILLDRTRLALRSSRLDLAALAKLEGRLEAHLDGVMVGIEGRALDLRSALDLADTSAAAAMVLLRMGAHEPVLDALERSPRAAIGIGEALCISELPATIEHRLRSGLASGDAKRAALSIEVLSFHRRLEFQAIESLVGSPDERQRRAAARAAFRIGAPEAWLEPLTRDEAPEVRDGALAAAARWGSGAGIEWVRAACRDRERISAIGLMLLGSVGARADLELVLAHARSPLQEAAIEAMAALGFVEAIPYVIELMEDERSARAAGATFHRITGLEVRDRRAEPLPPEVEDRTFDDLRPVPDPWVASARWREKSAAFDPAVRWRYGKPLETERWRADPHRGDLLTRREELARLWTHEPTLFPRLELDAPAARQRAST